MHTLAFPAAGPTVHVPAPTHEFAVAPIGETPLATTLSPASKPYLGFRNLAQLPHHLVQLCSGSREAARKVRKHGRLVRRRMRRGSRR